MAIVSGVSVLAVEFAEHPRDGGGLGGKLHPLHRSAAELTSTDIDLPHVAQKPRPGTPLRRALHRDGVAEGEGFDPLDCTAEYLRLAKKTKERDTNDWHTWDPTPTATSSCTKITAKMVKNAKNKIGDPTVASKKHIPAPTKGKCP